MVVLELVVVVSVGIWEKKVGEVVKVLLVVMQLALGVIVDIVEVVIVVVS